MNSKTILVIDDEPIIRLTSNMMLKKLGYNVILAEDGNTGVEQYRQNSDTINLVIVDMLMPDMTGEETFSKIREINQDATIILATGLSEKDDEYLKSYGFYDILKKPFSVIQLKEICENVFNNQ